MHVLVTGAAGMIGRKFVERVARDGRIGKKPVERMTLTDVVAPTPPKAAFRMEARADDIAASKRRRGSGEGTAGADPASCRHRLGRGRERFREGLPRQSRRHPPAPRSRAEDRRRLQTPFRLRLLDRGLRRTFSRDDPGRVPPHSAHQLRHAERRSGSSCSPTTRAGASSMGWACGFRQSACVRARRTRQPRGSSRTSSASRLPARRWCCRFRRPCAIPMRRRAPR